MNPYARISDGPDGWYYAFWALGCPINEAPKEWDLAKFGWESWINTGLTGTWRTKDSEAVQKARDAGW